MALALRPQVNFAQRQREVRQTQGAPATWPHPGLNYTCRDPEEAAPGYGSDEDPDPYSERNLLHWACDLWFDQWSQGNHTLTPPYRSMKNWRRRLNCPNESATQQPAAHEPFDDEPAELDPDPDDTAYAADETGCTFAYHGKHATPDDEAYQQ